MERSRQLVLACTTGDLRCPLDRESLEGNQRSPRVSRPR